MRVCSYAAAGVLIAAVLLHINAVESVAAIADGLRRVQSGLGYPPIAVPDAGLEVIGSPAKEAVALLRRNKIAAFTLGPKLAGHPEAQQRVVEAAYPIAWRPAGRFRLLVGQELDESSCRVLDRIGSIGLAECADDH